MVALYVEIDDYCAAWLRNLIQRGVIADGDVYCGDMRDCRPQDLARYNQVHLFAGIGVWSYALRRAGIPDTANVWTFSEPCQPFSAAGKGLGFADERYLRPYTHHLVTQCRPAICLGEQVASGDGLAWLDIVQADMEDAGYAGGAIDTCSAGFGAPHIRQRLRIAYTLADAKEQRRSWLNGKSDARAPLELERSGVAGSLANPDIDGLQGSAVKTLLGTGWRIQGDAVGRSGAPLASIVGNTNGAGPQPGQPGICVEHDAIGWNEGATEIAGLRGIGHNSPAGPTNGFWSDADWLYCRDGKWRPVEPGSFPLAHGATSRVGRLRAYGNAVDAEATTEFCAAVRDVFNT